METARIKVVQNYNHRMVSKMVRYWDKAACLVPGTLITTDKGLVPIEKISIGDLVLTRKGFRKVQKAMLSGYVKQLVTVLFSDGRELTGTHDHPVFTKNRGWVHLIDLKREDEVYQDKEIPIYPVTVVSTVDVKGQIVSQFRILSDNINDKSLKSEDISDSASNIRDIRDIRDIRIKIESIQKSQRQKIEESKFSQCGKLREGVPVYDLTVQDQHEFFANGILVHNTDDKSASHTVGLLMALMQENFGDYGVIVLDVVSGQWNQSIRDKMMRQTAEMDGLEVQHVVEQEPGSGGKESALNSIKKVLFGFKCSADRPTGDKEVRLEPFCGQVDNDNVAILKGTWNKEYINGLEECAPGNVTDFGDASSGAFNWLNGLAGKQKSKVRISIR